MGYGDLSCLNEKAAFKTPHLDRLAAEGMRCVDAHSSSAVCTPSRYSVLTGRYNWRSVLKRGVTGGYSQPILEPGRLTVASMLKQQGYRTACVGKWHLGLEWRLKDGGVASTYQDEGLIERYAASDSPFFIYFPLPAPHTPILPTEAFRGKSGTNEYGDFCLQVDDTVGRVMAALERNGLEDITIVVFTADNGCSPMADFEELAACNHNPSYVFRGHKADIFDGGHRSGP